MAFGLVSSHQNISVPLIAATTLKLKIKSSSNHWSFAPSSKTYCKEPKKIAIKKMPKYTRNAGKVWSPKEVQQLRSMAKDNTPTRVMGLKLGRPEAGVRAKASEKGISLRPTNQSPYNRQK